MFENFKQSVQQAFFDSLDRVGCVSLQTDGPVSSDEEDDVEEDEEWDEEDEEEEPEDAQAVLTPTRVVGFGSFLRRNPKTDRFRVERVHHVELWCADATNTALRLSWALGLPLAAKSDLSTGNHAFTTFVLKGGELALCFTAASSSLAASLCATSSVSESTSATPSRLPFPCYDAAVAKAFFAHHGLAVRAIALEVADVAAAYRVSMEHGAKGVAEPREVRDAGGGGTAWMAEVELYGQVVLRYVMSKGYKGPFLPNFAPASNQVMAYGVTKLDHAVGVVANLQGTLSHIANFTGFHEFDESGLRPGSRVRSEAGAKQGAQGRETGGKWQGAGEEGAGCDAVFVSQSEDPSKSPTMDALLPPSQEEKRPWHSCPGEGRNYVVLANNEENVLLPTMEPGKDPEERQQLERFLAHNGGDGVQHLALMCTDLVSLVQEMRARSELGGIQLLPRPPAKYYEGLRVRFASVVSEKQMEEYQELGILVDLDDRGLLLQIFTKPITDRPTLFLELVQRVSHRGSNYPSVGCGGFGKGSSAEALRIGVLTKTTAALN